MQTITDGRIRHFSLPNALDAINGTLFFDARGVRLLVGVIARSHHRADGGMGKAHRRGLALEHPEGVGVDVAAHRQVRVRGGEVLAAGGRMVELADIAALAHQRRQAARAGQAPSSGNN